MLLPISRWTVLADSKTKIRLEHQVESKLAKNLADERILDRFCTYCE